MRPTESRPISGRGQVPARWSCGRVPFLISHREPAMVAAAGVSWSFVLVSILLPSSASPLECSCVRFDRPSQLEPASVAQFGARVALLCCRASWRGHAQGSARPDERPLVSLVQRPPVSFACEWHCGRGRQRPLAPARTRHRRHNNDEASPWPLALSLRRRKRASADLRRVRARGRLAVRRHRPMSLARIHTSQGH